jgi:hypothetical protein
VAVDGGPQLHQLAPEVVDVVGDQPNVLIIVGGSRTPRVEPPLSRMAKSTPESLRDTQVWSLLFDPSAKRALQASEQRGDSGGRHRPR